MDTQTYRSDVFTLTAQAGGSWEGNLSLGGVGGHSCHQVTLNTMLKQNNAFYYYIHTEIVQNNTVSPNPAYLI